VLIHELCHATAGAFNHGVRFQGIAKSMCLKPVGSGKHPWKQLLGMMILLPSTVTLSLHLGRIPTPS